MSGLAIYMEGGGDGKESHGQLRIGMVAFLAELKDAVRLRRWRWKLVCCGGRNQAFDAFRHAREVGDFGIVVLLVDAEGPVHHAPRAHLEIRGDPWDLNGIPDNVVHLMVQTMEAWIVADPDAVAVYYGQRFNRNALPKNPNLEDVAKADVSKALAAATGKTQKGTYHKIRHASDLLKKIDPQKVRARCANCARMFDELGKIVSAG